MCFLPSEIYHSVFKLLVILPFIWTLILHKYSKRKGNTEAGLERFEVKSKYAAAD